MTEVKLKYFEPKLQYHEGFYAAGNAIPWDENASDDWKEGYVDGEYSLYGESEHHCRTAMSWDCLK